MNIDYLANLIESADVPTFRTIATLFLRSIGHSRGFFSDGPYDGGVDFFVHEDNGAGIQTAFQLSIERNWRGKLEAEIKKAKFNYPTVKVFVFVSNRRIPLNSIRKVNATLIQQHGMAATHYDNQSIATEFVDKNLVAKLYEALNIVAPPESPKARLTPQAEAASALLLFGSNSGDFRTEMTANLLVAELERIEPIEEQQFIDTFAQKHNLTSLQKPDVRRTLRRIVQSKRVVQSGSQLRISEASRTQLAGVKSLATGEFEALRKSIEDHIATTPLANAPGISSLLLDNLLALSIALWRRHAPQAGLQNNSIVDEKYHQIHASLAGSLGPAESLKTVADLAAIVANSDFAKKIAAAELFYSLLQSGSTHLVSALGGTKGLFVVFDTSALIPLLCGLLFDKVDEHAAYSARLLVALLEKHKFTAQAPSQYIEEAAGHLVECCRHYQALLLENEDLSYSSNAFASHFSLLRKLPNTQPLSFDDYIAVFGSPAGSRYTDLSDEFFYPTIEKISTRMSHLFQRYGVELLELDNRKFDGVFNRIAAIIESSNMKRSSILIAHDSRVVGYLESPAVEAGFSKVLCTWDSVQHRLNPNWDSYCVMTPASVTDLFSIIRSDDTPAPMAQLMEYVWMQSDKSSRLAAQVWDEIVAVEKAHLSDGALLTKARQFRQHFIDTHQHETSFDPRRIATEWLEWKDADGGA
jgi:hypothetical protein